MGRGAESDGGQGGLSRRAFLGRAGAAGAVAMVPGAMLAPSARAAHELAQLRTFTAAQAATLEAVLERLIPTDATGPGAKEANVLRYVDWALAGELGAYKDAYVAGLAALDAYSQASQGAPFASLSPAQQDAVLSAMESGKATGFTPDAKSVFEMMRTHCLQGMFGDPVHGGNVGFVGWDLVRFPGPRLIIPARDQRLDVTPKTVRKSTADYPNFGLKKLNPKEA